MLRFVLILLVGGFAGVMTGLMGASGVMAVVPGMVVLGYTAHQAIGTSLAVDMIASLVVTWTYLRHGRVDLHQGLWIALTAVLGAQFGSRLSVYVPEVGLSGGFGILLIVSAALIWRNGALSFLDGLQESGIARLLKRHPLAASLFIGLYAGVYCGLFGSGGGLLFLFALLLLGYSLHQAVGTSTMIMALTTASGAVGHAMVGNLSYLTVAGIATGTVLGSYGSSRLANQMNERFLSRAMAVVLGCLGVAIFISPLIVNL